jgi:hypothetical protein
MQGNKKIRVHFKSNHANPDSFPPTIEGESVFAITQERYRAAIESYPDLKDKIDPVFDWDLDSSQLQLDIFLGLLQIHFHPLWLEGMNQD